jgi:hypothetical protein
MRMFLQNLIALPLGLARRGRRALKRLGCGCLLTILLILAALATLFALLINRVAAAPTPTPTPAPAEAMPLALCLLLDESVSNTTLAGLGSDPAGLRHDAARFLITYLGVDAPGDAATPHEICLIHFGSTADLTLPLTPLTPAGRAALLSRLIPPEPLGWTDHLAALILAIDTAAHAADRAPVLVLFTDGKSDWDDATPVDRDAYLTALRAQGHRLAGLGGRLFIVLLANEATDSDPEIAAVWKPLWQEMAAASDGGRFYEVRRPEDLTAVYHEIVAHLTGHLVAPPVIDVTAAAAPTRHTILVEPGLAGLTLVIAKSDPTTNAQIFLPDGRRLSASSTDVRHDRSDGATGEEVWQVANPPPGLWAVLLHGRGRVLVWKDVRLASPPPTAKPATPTATPTPAPIPATPTITATSPLPLAPARLPATPLPLPALTPTAAGHDGPDTAGRRLWLLLPLAVGAGLALLRRRRPAIVSGALRVLVAGKEEWIDLEALNRPRLTVGSPPADVFLPIETRFTLASRRAGRAVEIVLHAGNDALRLLFINGRPPAPEQPLHDMDLIRCGDLRLRYENLALRPADAWIDRADDLEPLNY